MSIQEDVNKWVENLLEGYSITYIKNYKVIRDALIDTSKFYNHEISIIDTPLIQRLKRIFQTGFAYQVYPCARHTRFEHTLGVTTNVDKFTSAIKSKTPKLINDTNIYELRMSGLLHDTGHGPFSHVSENFYGRLDEVKNELDNNPIFSKTKTKPHEMLSYYIVTSKRFQELFEEIKDKYSIQMKLDNVANYIVGYVQDRGDAYLNDIINGSFDADKLDYLPRDCYFTGIKMEVDIDRIMYTILVDDKKTNNRRGLIVDISGAPFIEQVLFNKMMLYTSIYHHHKVRSIECMLSSIFEVTKDNNLNFNGHNLNNVTGFLSLTDYDILTLDNKNKETTNIIDNLLNRRLLKRALVISMATIKKPLNCNDKKAEKIINMRYYNLLKLDYKQIKELRSLIADKVGNGLTIYDVWIDIPKPPSFSEPVKTIVKITDDERKSMDEIFPISKWLTAYGANKWKGHVFCPPEFRGEVNKAAKKILSNEIGIEFNPFATSYAKIE